MSKKDVEIHVGTSGWSYPDWKKTFYLEGLKPEDWLTFLSTVFPTVEINTTFYHTPSESTIKGWFKKVPDDFIFSIKASRYITHLKRLKECKGAVKFFYSRIKLFKTKLGPILFQLPPSFPANKKTLNDFLKLLDYKYRYVFEFRHDTWFTEEYYKILRKHDIALCITDLNGKQTPEVITTDFTYLRLHGPHKSYEGSYGKTRLKKFKKKFVEWAEEGTSVYCYFDNDAKGDAAEDATTLIELF